MIQPIQPRHQVTYDGVALNIYHADKGQGLPRHQHIFSHLTTVHSGLLIVRKESRELVMSKDTQPVNLIANEWHEIEVLENGTVFVNIFAENKY